MNYVPAAGVLGARLDPKLGVSKLSHATDETTSQFTAAAPLLLKATDAVAASQGRPFIQLVLDWHA